MRTKVRIISIRTFVRFVKRKEQKRSKSMCLILRIFLNQHRSFACSPYSKQLAVFDLNHAADHGRYMTIVEVPNEKNRNGNTTKIDKKVGDRCILFKE